MIFGTTDEEKRAAEQRRLRRLYENRFRVFALFPKTLVSGKIAWLQCVWAKYPVSKGFISECDYTYHHEYDPRYYETKTGDQ